MEVNTSQLQAGMVVARAIIGKSGKPIIPQNTALTETHIEFIDKFLIPSVTISSLGNEKVTLEKKQEEVKKPKKQTPTIEAAVQTYQRLWNSWVGNIPVDMFAIRSTFTPIFETLDSLSMHEIIQLPHYCLIKDKIYSEQVAIGLLAVKLAKHLNYEKKDWLQIGFAGLLCNAGMTKINVDQSNLRAEEMLKQHPLYSYKLVESVTTLTAQTKMAILQHHERLDGSGYPAGARGEKIHTYARIIAICEFFVTNSSQDYRESVLLLQEQTDKLDGNLISSFIDVLNEAI